MGDAVAIVKRGPSLLEHWLAIPRTDESYFAQCHTSRGDHWEEHAALFLLRALSQTCHYLKALATP